MVAVPPSARLPRLRRRRRRRRRARHLGRRGAGAQGQRPPADRRLRRRRLPDGRTALWTAAHYRIPLLIVVANNRSFYNDEVHQERVARMRNRPVENKWIGQRISDPDIDLAALARAQGAHGFGPIDDARASLRRRSRKAIAAVEQGGVAVVDVRVAPGYTPAMTRRGARDADEEGVMAQLDHRSTPDTVASQRRRPPSLCSSSRHRQAFRDAGRRAHRGRRHLVQRRAGRVPGRDRPVRLRQVHAVQHHRRAARRLRGPRHRRGRDGAAARTPRSAWSSRRSRPSPGAPCIDNVAFPLEIAGMAEGGARRARRATSSSWSASTASSAAIRPSFPAACASASRSRARSPPSRRSC